MRHAEREVQITSYIKPQDEECAVQATPDTCTILFIKMDRRSAIRIEAIISSSRFHGRLNNDASSTAAMQHSHIKHERTQFYNACGYNYWLQLHFFAWSGTRRSHSSGDAAVNSDKMYHDFHLQLKTMLHKSCKTNAGELEKCLP